ncbi:PseG/SpsG family protein [Candidatus Omnitrophota bacterium]
MIFWIEASKQIGMGHLMESLAIAEVFQAHDIPFHFIINHYQPAEELLASKNILFDVTPVNKTDKIFQSIMRYSRKNCVIVNHRNVLLSVLLQLKKRSVNTIVIDQLGNKTVACDLLVNSALVPEWLKYTFKGKQPECYFGPRFVILRNEFTTAHKKEKIFGRGLKTILVSMGGVDRSGAAFRIIEALQLIKGPLRKEIVLGKGFAHIDKFSEMRRRIKDPLFNFCQGVDDMAERIYKADLMISAGGNTAYEMACAGTPGLILWEDLHEKSQAQVFAEKGVALELGNGMRAPILEIRDSIKGLLDDTEKRIQMSQCGKRLVDGQGINRIFKDITELVQK